MLLVLNVFYSQSLYMTPKKKKNLNYRIGLNENWTSKVHVCWTEIKVWSWSGR